MLRFCLFFGSCDTDGSSSFCTAEVGNLVESPSVGDTEMVADETGDVAGGNMGFMAEGQAKELSRMVPCKPGIVEVVVLMGITLHQHKESAGINNLATLVVSPNRHFRPGPGSSYWIFKSIELRQIPPESFP